MVFYQLYLWSLWPKGQLCVICRSGRAGDTDGAVDIKVLACSCNFGTGDLFKIITGGYFLL